jgi:hypothetical protein
MAESVFYPKKNIRIMKGSEAWEIYHDKSDKNRKRLDKHLDKLDQTWRDLEGRQ